MNPQTAYLLAAVGAGVCLALQAAVNGSFRRTLDAPLWATFFSVCGTIVFAGAAMLAIRPPMPAGDLIRSTQWWQWIGGPLGTLIVLAGALVTPRLGAATFVALVVAGQIAAALILDHVGLMGLTERAISPGRLLGGVLIVGGVLCVKYL